MAEPSAPASESVWDYPRPPRLEPVSEPVRVELGGEVIARSGCAVRVCETASPPVIYLPPNDVRAGVLEPVAGHSLCEWKGRASYFDAVVGDRRAERAAWTHLDPDPAYAELRDWIAFYPGRVDAAYLAGELVRPQPGGFYGGWITARIEGPFKGEPGSEGW